MVNEGIKPNELSLTKGKGKSSTSKSIDQKEQPFGNGIDSSSNSSGVSNDAAFFAKANDHRLMV